MPRLTIVDPNKTGRQAEGLEEQLRRSIVGQDQVILEIVRAYQTGMRRPRVGVNRLGIHQQPEAEFTGRYMTATEIESRKQEAERIRQENVRVEERTRIAQELHDTLLQTFQSASLHLGAVVLRLAQDSPVRNQLDRILGIMRQGIEEGRGAIQGLRSTDSQSSDLVGALSCIQDELKVKPDIDFCVTVTGRQKQLARHIQHEIYRIGREALVNAFCHSGAKRIELELEYSDSELHVRIRDNGRGIDSQVLGKGRDGHWGLAGMRERATRIGGVIKISSSPASGTEVQLSIQTSSIKGIEADFSCAEVDRGIAAGEPFELDTSLPGKDDIHRSFPARCNLLIDEGRAKIGRHLGHDARNRELVNCPGLRGGIGPNTS